jgi:glycosyltransferase involved in cell wall biosynthesis
MRVALVSRFFDLRNGGIGRFSQEMQVGLEKRGVQVVPVSDQGAYNRRSYAKYTLMDLHGRMPKGCDVYHCLTPMESMYAPKHQSVVTFMDLIPWLHSDGLMTHYAGGSVSRSICRYYFGFMVRQAVKASKLAAISSATAGELVEHLDVDGRQVEVIRLGISPGLIPQPRRHTTFRVGTLSYLDRRKRIDILVKAWQAAGIDGELVIGGDGRDRERLEALSTGGPSIRFAGFVPDNELADFYNSLDLFVFPTRVEGYGLPIVEAMACGLPVVVLGDAVIPEDLRRRCTVTNNLVQTLRQAAEWTGSGSLSQRQRDNLAFARAHSWDKCVEQYIQLYEGIARGGETRANNTPLNKLPVST